MVGAGSRSQGAIAQKYNNYSTYSPLAARPLTAKLWIWLTFPLLLIKVSSLSIIMYNENCLFKHSFIFC